MRKYFLRVSAAFVIILSAGVANADDFLDLLRFKHFSDPSWTYEASRRFIEAHNFEAETLSVVSRESWGARSPRATLDPLGTVFGIVLHHTLTHDLATIKSIQNHHMDGNRWDDIGYHYVIARDENLVWQIFEGRVEDRMGAHAGVPRDGVDPDIGKIGISMVGNFGRRSEHNPGGWPEDSGEHERQPEKRVQLLLGTLMQDILNRHLTVSDFYTHRTAPHNVNPEGGVCPGRGALHLFEAFEQKFGLRIKDLDDGLGPIVH